jgi:hypothetical protein
MADKMSQLMHDENLRISMSLAGQKKAHRFEMQQIAERWKSLFELNE